MSSDTTRRGFLGAAAGIAGFSAAAAEPAVESETGGFKLGVASYSMREFQRPLAIKMIKELQTTYVSVKEFHLPYRDTPAELARGRKEFEAAGLQIMSGGVVNTSAEEDSQIRRYFDYAKVCGMPMLIMMPTARQLPAIEKLVQEYNIRVAIHNHGPEDKNFPKPQSVLAAVKNLDSRIGLCMDIGHSSRTGVDVVKSLGEAGPRLFDAHIKDLKNALVKESQCDVGEGVLPIVGCFEQLHKMGYRGCVNLEYEINIDAPLTGMLKSFAYMRGALAGMKGTSA
ncbi:MAG: sugar phosphate isomerase/epimerase family protein [Bryobacteraceae bacterium]